MIIEKINMSTWRIEDGFVRCFLLAGKDQAILIDSGASSADARMLAESVTSLPVVLVNTHGDGDHVAGNGAFESFYMHPADYANCQMASRCPQSRLIPLQDGDVLDPGGRPLEIIGIPGHTNGSVAILDTVERVLYSGDSIQDGRIFMFGGHRQPDAFAGSLDKLAAMRDRFDSIRAAHGTPELPAVFVQKVRDAWQQVLDGKIEGYSGQLHGHTVRTFDADGCGFYCG